MASAGSFSWIRFRTELCPINPIFSDLSARNTKGSTGRLRGSLNPKPQHLYIPSKLSTRCRTSLRKPYRHAFERFNRCMMWNWTPYIHSPVLLSKLLYSYPKPGPKPTTLIPKPPPHDPTWLLRKMRLPFVYPQKR